MILTLDAAPDFLPLAVIPVKGSSTLPCPFLALPLEILDEIAQYLVTASDVRDFFRLCSTCKGLYFGIWHDSAETWKHVWRSLYDDSFPFNPKGKNDEGAGEQVWPNVRGYKAVIMARMECLKMISQVSVKDLPWQPRGLGPSFDVVDQDWGQDDDELQEGHTENEVEDIAAEEVESEQEPELIVQEHDEPEREPDTVAHVQDDLSSDAPEQARVELVLNSVREAFFLLTRIGSGEGTKNLRWIHDSVSAEMWAYVTYLWFQVPANDVSTKAREFLSPATLYGLFRILSQIATFDPLVLSAVYRNKFESFRYLRGALFRQEDTSIYRHMCHSSYPRSPVPWSISQVFFMTLFCGPYAHRQLLSSQAATQGNEPRPSNTLQTTPTWFNFGTSAVVAGPIPLVRAVPFALGTTKTRLNGRWSGYYAYQNSTPDLGDAEDDVNAEFGAQGVGLDSQMYISLADSKSEEEDEPTYLTKPIDVNVMKAMDRSFHTGHRTVEQPFSFLGVDDLDVQENWNHHRVFSGRGIDSIGSFRIRGTVSEKTGLVRMIKNYFDHRQHSQEEIEALLANEPLDRPAKDLQFEFGHGHDEVETNLWSESIVWFYRGQLTDAGILGSWYNDYYGGPFWIYRTQC